MSQVLINESSLQDIASALREKTGTETTFKPSEMADAILELSSVNQDWFGDGRDGDLVVGAGETYTIDVAQDEGQIVLQLNNLTIEEGGSMVVSGRHLGLVILCKNDFICNGTIDVSKQAPLLSVYEDQAIAEKHVALCALTGGNGGSGGNSRGTGYTGTSGQGGTGHVLGGGNGGGSGASMNNAYTNYRSSNSTNVERMPIGTTVPYIPTLADPVGYYGAGGSIYPLSGTSGFAAGGGSPGGTGAVFNGSSRVAGATGDAYGGGAVFIFVGGKVEIGATGVIAADGGTGANGKAQAASTSSYALSGGGGGGGGGIIALIHNGDIENRGSFHANGGKAGVAGSKTVSSTLLTASPGTDGSIGSILISTLSDLLA